MRSYFIYILTNRTNTTLYIGGTNDLDRRMFEHIQGIEAGFTSRYKLTKLVYLEEYPTAKEAIAREKQLKNWHREWKLNLIREKNPKLRDLNSVELDSEPSSE